MNTYVPCARHDYLNLDSVNVISDNRQTDREIKMNLFKLIETNYKQLIDWLIDLLLTVPALMIQRSSVSMLTCERASYVNTTDSCDTAQISWWVWQSHPATANCYSQPSGVLHGVLCGALWLLAGDVKSVTALVELWSNWQMYTTVLQQRSPATQLLYLLRWHAHGRAVTVWQFQNLHPTPRGRHWGHDVGRHWADCRCWL